MAKREEQNLEIVFTLKLNGTCMNGIENQTIRPDDLVIVRKTPGHECVGKVVIGKQDTDSTPISKTVSDGKADSLPRKRGRRPKQKEESDAKVAKTTQVEKTPSQPEGEHCNGPMDLSKTAKIVEKEVTEEHESLQGRVEEKVDEEENQPLDLSASSSMKSNCDFTNSGKVGKIKYNLPNPMVSSTSKIVSRTPLVATDAVNLSDVHLMSTQFMRMVHNHCLPMLTSDGKSIRKRAPGGGRKKKVKTDDANPRTSISQSSNKVPISDKVYFCDSCEYKTASKFILKRHEMEEHVDARPFACRICTHRFKQKPNLKAHYVQKHKLHEEDAARLIPQNSSAETVPVDLSQPGSPEDSNSNSSGLESEHEMRDSLPSPGGPKANFGPESSATCSKY